MAAPKILPLEKGCNPASVYGRISSSLGNIFHKYGDEAEPTAIAYMIARYALLAVRSQRGSRRAAELAYKLADEFAGEK